MKIQGFIYKYTFPNGKIYIGQTRVSVKERLFQHVSDSKKGRGSICEMAIAKYGEPTVETIETIEVDETKKTQLIKKLNEAEIKWIKEFDSTNRLNGYNVQLGGNISTPEEFILEEKWYEIYKRDHWGESLYIATELLKAIKVKLLETHEKLTKDENYIWHGYKFMDFEINKETTFCVFYKRNKNNPFLNDIGDLPYEVLENLENENEDKRRWAEKEEEKVLFDNIIKIAIEENWIKDIQQTIWKQIMQNKDKIIKEWYSTIK